MKLLSFLFLAALTASPAGALPTRTVAFAPVEGWVQFQAPDKSFEISTPIVAKPSTQGPKTFLWTATDDSGLYLFGYAPVENLNTLDPKEALTLFCDSFVKSAEMKETGRKNIGEAGQEIEIAGTMSGAPTHTRVHLHPGSSRFYILMYAGAGDADRYFDSLHLVLGEPQP